MLMTEVQRGITEIWAERCLINGPYNFADLDALRLW